MGANSRVFVVTSVLALTLAVSQKTENTVSPGLLPKFNGGI